MFNLMTSYLFVQGIYNPALDPKVGSGEGFKILGNLIGAVVGFFIVFGVIFALLHLLFGAIRWITASGDKNQLQNAQDRITHAIVGLIILASIWALMVLISNFLGLGAFPKLFLTKVGESPPQLNPQNFWNDAWDKPK